MGQVEEMMALIAALKVNGLIEFPVLVNICTCLVQPIKDRVHSSYEVVGPSDPTREDNRSVSVAEVRARMAVFMSLPIENQGGLQSYSVFLTPPVVSVVLL